MISWFEREIIQELKPFEGRFETAWRIALICSLAALVFMTYGIPLVAIGCYLILFVMKPDPAESTLMAIGISVLVSIVVPVLVLLTNLAIDVPLWRMVIIAASSFLFLFLGAASQLGPAGSILALVVAFIMTLLGNAPFGEVATRGILYAWLMAAVPMGLIIVCNVAFGRSVPRLLQRLVAERLNVVADVLHGQASADDVWTLLRKGNTEADSYMKYVALFHLIPKVRQAQLKAAVTRSYELLIHASQYDSLRTADDKTHVAQRGGSDSYATESAAQCRRLAQAFQAGQYPAPPPQQAENVPVRLQPFTNAMALLYTPVPEGRSAPHSGFFYPDALTNPVYQRFALKTTLAALIAYTAYTAMDWQDIHTAMITCYVAALGSTGETVHKLTLRILGCLVGAAMGVLSILFLIPLMTSIGQLMLLVFVGILCAGWVSSGSERSAYAGVQVGLAFLLTVLQGFGPDVQMSVALDRIMGILLGNLILYLVFTRIWPISAAQAARARLSAVLERLSWYSGQSHPGPLCSPNQTAQNLAALDAVREQLSRVHFEPRSLRPPREVLDLLKKTLKQGEVFGVRMALAQESRGTVAQWERQLTDMRHQLSVQPA
ncbi:FUSC family protein [Neopusillimonas maritima]|uniref:FUSC family protein n=1 Tax=Neopusillimonas maritima TaxID=2026239 RepID=A0A3A1YVC6_9BURK|nr:FUSC family protein [Neopusillimonas maritima]RIY41239.1 hypothetical protein CJP73_06805 [Neopusillimonas maritima]